MTNSAPTAPDLSASLVGLLRTLASPPTERAARHRGECLAMAVASLPPEASIYDRVVAADYLENGLRVEQEPPQCSCQTAEATHPRGDEAYCEMRQ